MPELNSEHINRLERFAAAGFSIIAFPMYGSAVGVRKGSCAALLEPMPGGGFSLVGSPSYLIGGNLSVRIHDAQGEWFVFKSKRVEANPARLREVAAIECEIKTLLKAP